MDNLWEGDRLAWEGDRLRNQATLTTAMINELVRRQQRYDAIARLRHDNERRARAAATDEHR